MVGNIIELNNPTAKILHIDNNPFVIAEISIMATAEMAKIDAHRGKALQV